MQEPDPSAPRPELTRLRAKRYGGQALYEHGRLQTDPPPARCVRPCGQEPHVGLHPGPRINGGESHGAHHVRDSYVITDCLRHCRDKC